jgi:hypothetical protein
MYTKLMKVFRNVIELYECRDINTNILFSL